MTGRFLVLEPQAMQQSSSGSKLGSELICFVEDCMLANPLSKFRSAKKESRSCRHG